MIERIIRLFRGPRRSKLSPFAITLAVILLLLAGSFYTTYRIAAAHLEQSAREVDAEAFRQAVSAAENLITLADIVLIGALGSREMRHFVRQDFATETDRRLLTRQLQGYLGSLSRAVPGYIRMAVVPESAALVATDRGLFAESKFWDPYGLDMVKTAPVRGRFALPRTLRTGSLEGSWQGDAITIARGYPIGVAPNLAVGGGILYLDASIYREIFRDLEERTGVHVGIEDPSRPSAHRESQSTLRDRSDPRGGGAAGRPFWQSDPIIGGRSGWRYTAFAAQSPVTETLVFRRFFAIAALAIMMIAAVVVTILDRTTRRPLETAVKHIADRVYRARSDAGGAASLSDVEREVRAIVDEATRLQSQVEVSLPALRWQLLVERLMSPTGSQDTDVAMTIGLRLPGPLFTVILIGAPRDSEDLTRAKAAVLEGSATTALAAVGPVEAVRLLNGMVAAIVSTDAEFPADRAEELLRPVLALDPSISVAVGKSVAGPDAVHRSYGTAREALEYHIVAHDRRVHVFGDLPTDTNEELPGEIETSLRDLPPILHRDGRQRLVGWFDDYFATVQRRFRSPTGVKHALVRLVLLLRAEVRTVLGRDGLDGDEIVHEIWSSTSFDAVRDLVADAVERAHTIISTEKYRNAPEHRLGLDIAAYVDANVHRQELSLSMVAEAFSLSPSHVSRVFRGEVGRTFQDYVTDQRVKQARLRLVEDDATVAEIAEEVGYGEVHSLIRAFKRVYGLTPTQYRRTVSRSQFAAGAS